MERFFDWYWRRIRPHPALGIWAIGSVTVIAVLVIPVTIGLALWLRWGVTEALPWSLIASSVVPVGVGIALVDSRIRLLRRWTTGVETDAVTIWSNTIETVWVLSLRGFVVLSVLHSVVSVKAIELFTDLTALEYFVAIVVSVGMTAVGGIVLALGMQMVVRPLLDEVIPLLPVETPPLPRSPSIAWRFLAGFLGSGFVSGVAASAWVSFGEGRANELAYGIGATVVFSVYAAVMLHFTLLTPSLAPLAHLTRGMERVRAGDFGEPLPITTGDELGDLARGFNEMQRGLAERSALHAAFGSYVDPVLAQRLLDQGSAVFDGEERDVTVLFADVRNFTSTSEACTPGEAVALLNRFFDVAVPIIEAHDGHTNHYLGDGLLAVFGAPNAVANHADAAVAAAVELQRAVAEKFGDELRIGIGVNTGDVIAGTVGGGGRLEFTVIGDVVNTASRVEQLTRDTGDLILITEATHTRLSAGAAEVEPRGDFALKGKAATVTVLALNPS